MGCSQPNSKGVKGNKWGPHPSTTWAGLAKGGRGSGVQVKCQQVSMLTMSVCKMPLPSCNSLREIGGMGVATWEQQGRVGWAGVGRKVPPPPSLAGGRQGPPKEGQVSTTPCQGHWRGMGRGCPSGNHRGRCPPPGEAGRGKGSLGRESASPSQSPACHACPCLPTWEGKRGPWVRRQVSPGGGAVPVCSQLQAMERPTSACLLKGSTGKSRGGKPNAQVPGHINWEGKGWARGNGVVMVEGEGDTRPGKYQAPVGFFLGMVCLSSCSSQQSTNLPNCLPAAVR